MNRKLITTISILLSMGLSITACSSTPTSNATPETATAETASVDVDWSKGISSDGRFENVVAKDYIDMPDDYIHYGINLDSISPSNEEITQQVNDFASYYGLTKEVTDRAAQSGDIANIAYVGTVGGVAFTGGTTDSYDLELGSGTFIDGFEDQIIGHKTGDEFEITVTFPSGYGTTTDLDTGEKTIELANKEAKFHITVNSISTYDVSDADVESAFSNSTLTDGTPVTTVELLRTYIKEKLVESNLQSSVQQYLIENVVVKKDSSKLIDTQLENRRSSLKQSAAELGQDVNEYIAYYSSYSTLDDYIESQRADVEDDLILYLSAQYMADEENYTPTENDIKAYVGTNYDSVVEELGYNYLAQKCLDDHVMNSYYNTVYSNSIS